MNPHALRHWNLNPACLPFHHRCDSPHTVNIYLRSLSRCAKNTRDLLANVWASGYVLADDIF